MRNFDYLKLKDCKWDSEMVSLIAKIHESKGRQDLYVRQKPAELERLVEIARTQWWLFRTIPSRLCRGCFSP